MPGSAFTPLSLIRYLQSLSPSASPYLHFRTSQFCSALDYLQRELPTFSANEVAGVAYFLSELKCWDTRTWRLLEMRVARTRLCDEFSFPALVRVSSAFSVLPLAEIDKTEALLALESRVRKDAKTHLQRPSGSAMSSLDDFALLVWSFGNCLMGSDALYADLEKVFMKDFAEGRRRQQYSVEVGCKVLWPYVYFGLETQRLTACIAQSIPTPIDTSSPWGSRLQWALLSSRYAQ